MKELYVLRRNNNELGSRGKSGRDGEERRTVDLFQDPCKKSDKGARYVCNHAAKKTTSGACEGSSYKTFSVTDRNSG